MTAQDDIDQTPLGAAPFAALRAIAGLPPCRRLALGTASLGGYYGPVDEGEAVRVLHDAWSQGFMLVDTAPNYGTAEARLARALCEWSGPPPVILTKLEGYPAFAPPTYARDWETSMERQLRASEALFGPHVIRGLAMHDAEYAAAGFADTCHAFLLRQFESGRVAAIGLGGGGPAAQSEWLSRGPYRYVITHLRLSAVTMTAMDDLIPLCRMRDVRVLAGSPLYAGLLGAPFDDARVAAVPWAQPVILARARALSALAAECGIPVAQLALRFLLSLDAADFVPVGPRSVTEWRDVRSAYEAGPLPADLFTRIGGIARCGEESPFGG